MKIAVLAKYVPRGDGRRRITAWLKSQGIREDHVVWMGCAPSQYDGNFNKTDLKEFRDHFAEVIDTHPVGGILCLGNEALYCATGHSGIMNWRGKVQWTECGKAVMPTLALGAVDRNPSQTGLLLADIRSLVNTLGGVDTPGDQPTRDRYTARVIEHDPEQLAPRPGPAGCPVTQGDRPAIHAGTAQGRERHGHDERPRSHLLE